MAKKLNLADAIDLLERLVPQWGDLNDMQFRLCVQATATIAAEERPRLRLAFRLCKALPREPREPKAAKAPRLPRAKKSKSVPVIPVP